jgi:putative transposase
MARVLRGATGGMIYHVLNRANVRARIFEKGADYEAFEKVLEQSCERLPMRVLAYCLMPNHWHLVLWPEENRDRDLSEFMRWLTVTHTQRWHAHHRTSGMGHLYQGRFKSFPVQDDGHFLTVCRYVERNALRAGLVTRAEDWRWGSMCRRTSGTPEQAKLLAEWPVERPPTWADDVNLPQSDAEMEALRKCVKRGQPFGDNAWVTRTAKHLELEPSLRPRGRPRKHEKDS